MKALKLILIALVAAGAVFGLLLLSKGGKGTRTSGTDEELFKKIEETLSRQWKEADEWDVALFDRSMAKLHQRRDDLGDGGFRTLVDMVSKEACNLLYTTTMAEFAKPDCDTSRIRTFSRDLAHFLAEEEVTGYAHDEKVKTMQGTYNLFNDILRLASKAKNAYVKPNFDFDNGTWNDFNSFERGLLQQKDSHIRNGYYQYLSNITAIKTALSSIEPSLAKAKTTFKNELAAQITKAFNEHEKSEQMRQKLAHLNRNFLETFGAQSTLRDYVLDYPNHITAQ